MQEILALDKELFLFLNGSHSPFWDFVMYWLSDRAIWIPFYLILIFLLFRQYGKKTWWLLLCVAFLISLSDQVCVHLFKEVFFRLRPCHEPSLAGLVYNLNGDCGGQYGFVSSHAGNTFALAVFLFGFFRKSRPWLAWGLFFWAAAIGYSRIYLGVHFPGDVITGALVGSLIGWGTRRWACSLISGINQ